MGEDSIFLQIVEFFKELVASLGDGYLFFGGPWDIVRYIVEMTGLSRSWAYREIKKLEI